MEDGQSRRVDEVGPPHPHFNAGLNPAKANTAISQDVDPVKALLFPAKLHSMLSRRDLSDVISWMPHGRSWKVHQPETFERVVVPKFFVSCKYSSFVRQANGWGFRRITKGPDRNSYYHEHFLRGRLHLCRHMRRAAPKEKREPPGGRPEERQPDFYRMSEVDPLPEIGKEGDGEGDGVGDSKGTTKKKMSDCAALPDSAPEEGRCMVRLQEAAGTAASAAAEAVASATAEGVSLAGLDDALTRLESAEWQCRVVVDAIRAVKRAVASVGGPDTASSGLRHLEGLGSGLRPGVGQLDHIALLAMGGFHPGQRHREALPTAAAEEEEWERVAAEVRLALSAAATSSRSRPMILAQDFIRQQLLSSSSLATAVSFDQQQHRHLQLQLSSSSSS